MNKVEEPGKLRTDLQRAKIELMAHHSPDAWPLFAWGMKAPVPTKDDLQELKQELDRRFRAWSRHAALTDGGE